MGVTEPSAPQSEEKPKGFAHLFHRALSNRRMFLFGTLAPAGIVLALLTLYPFITNVWYSLLQYDLTRPNATHFIGLQNYIDVLSDPDFRNALLRTAIYVVAAVGIELIFGLLIASLLNQNLAGQAVFRSLLVLPLAATPVAVALIWRLMFNPSGGLANHLLSNLGLPTPPWIGSSTWALPSLILVDVWQWTPFVILILLAGLLAMPEEPYEAARIDGASGLQTFWYLTLPMLSPMIYIAVLFRTIDSIKAFDTIWVMTGGGPGRATTTLNIHAFKTGFQFCAHGHGGHHGHHHDGAGHRHLDGAPASQQPATIGRRSIS